MIGSYLSPLSGPLAITSEGIAPILPSLEATLQAPQLAQEGLLARYEADIRRRRVAENGLESLTTGTENIQVIGRAAIMHIPGIITKRFDFLTWLLGGSSADDIRISANILAESPDIDTVVINSDTPGGSVQGVALAAGAIRELRSKKRVISVANDLMASAGYWIAGAADRIIVNPSSVVGSIGVFTIVVNYARLLEDMKIDVKVVRAGEFKARPNPYEREREGDEAIVQREVVAHYREFIQGVALNRKIDMSTAQKLADGLVHTGAEAIGAGLADGEGTLEGVVAESAKGEPEGRKSIFSFMPHLLGQKGGSEAQASEPATEPARAPEPVSENIEDPRIAALEAQVASLTSLVRNQTSVIQRSAMAQIEERNTAFVRELVAKAKIRGASAPGYLAILNALAAMDPADQAIAYNDKDGNSVKTTAYAFLAEQLSAALPIVDLEERAPSSGSAAGALTKQEHDAGDLAARARAYQEAEVKAGRNRPADHVAVAAVIAGSANN